MWCTRLLSKCSSVACKEVLYKRFSYKRSVYEFPYCAIWRTPEFPGRAFPCDAVIRFGARVTSDWDFFVLRRIGYSSACPEQI